MTTPQWRTLHVPTSRLRDAGGPNPNVMSEEDLRKLAANMREKGCLQPILVRGELPPPLPKNPLKPTKDELVAESLWLLSPDTLEVIDGSHRRSAAVMAELDTVPVMVIDVTDAQASALRIGMNKIRGDLDLATVGTMLADIQGSLYGLADLPATLDLCGYNEEEIADLVASVQPTDPDVDVMAGLGATNPSEPTSGKEKRYLLEVPFTDRKVRDHAKKVLLNLGEGNIAEGLQTLLAEMGETPVE